VYLGLLTLLHPCRAMPVLLAAIAGATIGGTLMYS
jgi:hypothetical protein